MWTDADNWKKIIGVVTALFAAIGGGYTMSDKIGLFKRPILDWAPQHFSISSGPATGSFDVVVARRKRRDDCSVESFALEVRDAKFFVHKAIPSVAKFSGPAGDQVQKFAYMITFEHPEKVNPGRAQLLAHIKYKCPEGERTVNYPDHPNLTFTVEAKK